MNTTISILIIDDHPIFRKGLRQVLEGDGHLRVVHESENGGDALRFLSDHGADIAVIDVEMPEMSGLELIRRLKEKRLPVHVVILTQYKHEYMVDEAFELGARGYVLKENAVLDILHAIRAVAQGDYYISPQVSSYIMKHKSREAAARANVPSLRELTPTELRILKLISMEKTSKEIADELYISSRTVDNHRTNICSKLNLHGPHKLLLFALENKDKL